MSHKLENYLRTHRRRAGLTQDEVAFLLGCKSGTKVSRYERFRRRPPLETVFAYEVIFRAPARELLAGTYQRVERTAVRRARLLAQTLRGGKQNRLTTRKLAALNAVASSVDRTQRAKR